MAGAVDLDGRARVAGLAEDPAPAVDMGAYEFGADSPSPPPPGGLTLTHSVPAWPSSLKRWADGCLEGDPASGWGVILSAGPADSWAAGTLTVRVGFRVSP